MELGSLLPGDKFPVVLVGIPFVLEISEFPIKTDTLDLICTKLFVGSKFDKLLLLRIMDCQEHIEAAKFAKFYCFLYQSSLPLLESVHTVSLVSYEIGVVNFLSNHYNILIFKAIKVNFFTGL